MVSCTACSIHGMQVTFNWARQLISRRSPSEVASTHCAERAGAQHWQPVRLTYFGGRSIGSELDSGRTRCEKVKETREGDAVGRRPPTAGSDASWGGVEGGESSHGSPQWEKGRLNAGRNIGSDLERLAFLFRGERTEGASSACPGDCVAVSWTWQRRPGEPWPLSPAPLPIARESIAVRPVSLAPSEPRPIAHVARWSAPLGPPAPLAMARATRRYRARRSGLRIRLAHPGLEGRRGSHPK
jgi:hypothetical protein